MSEAHRLQPGEPTVVESRPSPFQVVFEDDGQTGYLYLLDHRRGAEQPIVESLHVYDAANEQAGEPFELQIVWTPDGQAAALLLDGVACAMADFAGERFMSRTPLKPAQEWDQAAFDARFR